MQQDIVEIEVLKHQMLFIESNAPHTGLVAGFGAGKSKAGTYKTIEKKKQYPGINVAYYLPTYPLIKDIAFPNFEEALTQHGIPFHLNKSDKEFITPIGKIILRSMDNPSLIVGYQVGYSLIDEADILSEKKMNDCFRNIVARNRSKLPDDSANLLDAVSTPEGFKWMYNFFVKSKSERRVLIKAKTSDNPYLPSSYIETLKDIYTEQELAAYLNGEFVNLTSGTVFHCFDRKRNHTNREIKENDVLHIGMDFNITNMSAVIHVTDENILNAVEEVTKAYDTADMINVLNNRYPKRSIVIYPDASGDSRNTAGDSDIKLLRNAGFKVIVSKSNPKVKDRITVTNAAFKNANGVTTYFVNTNNCPQYTEALEQLAYKNGVPDKDSGFDHITDGGTYCAYKIKKINTTEEWGSSKAL